MTRIQCWIIELLQEFTRSQELEDDALKANQLAEKVMYGCLKAGISFKVSMGSVLTLAPALTISEFDLERSLQVICSMIQNQAELESTG